LPYLLDGDNLVGTARRRPGSREDRDALVAEISDRLRKTRANVVLFFDGDGPPLALGSLAVRYASPMSADDAIVREISRASSARETIVVTADRELGRRARDAGATALSPDEFWKRFGSAGPPEGGRPAQQPVNVDEWLEWFSDETNREK
jgi:hypothetical protein